MTHNSMKPGNKNIILKTNQTSIMERAGIAKPSTCGL